jgi:hypothetical protein
MMPGDRGDRLRTTTRALRARRSAWRLVGAVDVDMTELAGVHADFNAVVAAERARVEVTRARTSDDDEDPYRDREAGGDIVLVTIIVLARAELPTIRRSAEAIGGQSIDSALEQLSNFPERDLAGVAVIVRPEPNTTLSLSQLHVAYTSDELADA